MDSTILELEARRRIYELLSEHPGLHLREIARRLEMRTSLAEYHLRFLAKHDVVVQLEEEGYKRNYLQGSRAGTLENPPLGGREKRILGTLREQTPLHIILFLLVHPGAKHSEIRTAVGKAPSTISFQLRKLEKRGIITQQAGYHLSEPNKIASLLMRYKPGPPSLLEGFENIWSQLQQ